MNAIIRKILLFKGSDEKREVDLNSGLNIITGDSKTGKSALIEIVDYCLFASRSTIPKGKINDFADIFAIILKISDKYLIIARPNFKSGNGSSVYLRVESSEDFLTGINLAYLKEVELRPLKEAQEEVERHLGLSVLDTRTDEDDSKQTAGKVTLRSMVSLLFQHQNLIANKHSLFYRFDDYSKRKKTISDFPILIGWEDSKYFLLSRELEEKRKELKVEERLIEKLKVNDSDLKERIKGYVDYYYKFIGRELEENLSLSELIDIGSNLPSVNLQSFSDANIKLLIEKKVAERFSIKMELEEKELLIDNLATNSGISETYSHKLLSLRIVNSEPSLEEGENELMCPLCNNHVTEINDAIKDAHNSKGKLLEELSKIGTYTNDCSEQLTLLQKERDNLKRQIKKLSVEIKNLEDQDEAFKRNKNLTELSFYTKGTTEINIKLLLEQNNKVPVSSNINELKERIDWLIKRLDGFDLRAKIREAETFLSNRMTDICNKLDFEAELKPGKLQFSLTDFVFYYHYKEQEKVVLSEMGSGANWLACHLSLFIALLHLNCKSGKSSIPSFLMIDQPSQVYFPREYKKLENEESNLDENIAQVKNIFKVIEEEIKIIQDDCGFQPQIIVMDHADESDFSRFVRARWQKDGKKLI